MLNEDNKVCVNTLFVGDTFEYDGEKYIIYTVKENCYLACNIFNAGRAAFKDEYVKLIKL